METKSRKLKRSMRQWSPEMDPEVLYVRGDMSLEVLGELLKGRPRCSLGTLKRRSARDDWDQKRKDYRRSVAKQTLEQSAETAAEIQARQLTDSRHIQDTGKTLLAGAMFRIEQYGGVRSFLNSIRTPRDVIYCIRSGAMVLGVGMEAERQLIGAAEDVFAEILEHAAQVKIPEGDPDVIEVEGLVGPSAGQNGKKRNGGPSVEHSAKAS